MRLLVVALFFYACRFAFAAEPAPLKDSDFPGWPAGWVRAYRGFEEYISLRKVWWPAPELEIHPDGEVEHRVRQEETRSTHLDLTVYRESRRVFELNVDAKQYASGAKPNVITANVPGQMIPGRYAVGLRAITSIGYQQLYPWVWIDVMASAAAQESPPKLVVRTIKLPEPDEEHWPNERLFQFCDYHILPLHANPSQIEFGNRRVTPSVLLKLHQDGRLTRELLDPALERLLQWRIYRNGELVERGSAAGRTEWPLKFGWGDYRVFLGVEGPRGFMPVSNFRKFPLFPAGEEKVEVEPTDTNRDGIPDRLEKYLTADGDVRGGLEDDTGAGSATGPPTTPGVEPGKLSLDERRLIWLWREWEYDLRNRDRYDYIGLKIQ